METTLKLQNVKCGGCTNSIASRLSKISGIKNVDINENIAVVSFTYDTLNDLAAVERTLTQMGYPPEGATNNLKNKAMSYVSCMVGNLN